MKRILRGRGHGKTYDCIKLCIEENAILVEPYQSCVAYAESLAKRNFNKEIQIISMNDFITNKLKGSSDLKFVFDDAEFCLQVIVGHKNSIIGLSLDMDDI